LPDTASKVGVGSDGTVSIGPEIIAKLGLVRFENQQALERIGNSAYQNPVDADPPIPLVGADVKQQFLEGANVNAVHTMAMLIKTNRVFELNTRAMQAYKEMDEQSARDVGRLR
jgi:flagellar basal body rod protein FlgG